MLIINYDTYDDYVKRKKKLTKFMSSIPKNEIMKYQSKFTRLIELQRKLISHKITSLEEKEYKEKIIELNKIIPGGYTHKDIVDCIW